MFVHLARPRRVEGEEGGLGGGRKLFRRRKVWVTEGEAGEFDEGRYGSGRTGWRERGGTGGRDGCSANGAVDKGGSRHWRKRGGGKVGESEGEEGEGWSGEHAKDRPVGQE